MKISVVLFWTVAVLMIGCKKNEQADTGLTSKPVIVTEPDKPVSTLYVANEDGESVSVIDASKKVKIMDIDLSDHSVSMVMPHNVQVAPNGKTVWVTGMGMMKADMDQVIVIDPFTNKVIRRIYLGANLHLTHIVLDSDCENAFVIAYNINKVLQINTKSFNVVRTFNLDSNSGPHGVRYSKGKLYIANMLSKSMSIIDVTSGRIDNILLGGIAIQTAVTLDGKYVYISLYDTREVVKYHIETGITTRISLPSDALGPVQLYATPDSKSLYVCDQGALFGGPYSIRVFVIDTEMDFVRNTIVAGRGPHGVVVSNDGKYAYITNSGDNTVSVIDVSTNTVKWSIPAGFNPNGIGYWYGTGGMP